VPLFPPILRALLLLSRISRFFVRSVLLSSLRALHLTPIHQIEDNATPSRRPVCDAGPFSPVLHLVPASALPDGPASLPQPLGTLTSISTPSRMLSLHSALSQAHQQLDFSPSGAPEAAAGPRLSSPHVPLPSSPTVFEAPNDNNHSFTYSRSTSPNNGVARASAGTKRTADDAEDGEEADRDSRPVRKRFMGRPGT
jgi:hypothetical protein